MNINLVTITGNLTRDPELRATPSGTKVATFGVATNRVYKDGDGKKQEQVEYHNMVAWGKTGEIIAEYVHKGDMIGIIGRLQTRNWEDKKSGAKMYRTEIIVEQFHFGPKRSDGGGESRKSAYPKTTEYTKSVTKSRETEDHDENNGFGPQEWGTPKQSTGGGLVYPVEEINPDDIPF
jgi:single-strand DNA-binding protein